MALALQDVERKVITAALKFVNLRRITSADQVEQLFAGIKGFVFKSVESNYQTYIDMDQPRLRGWLTRITRSEADRARVANEMQPFLADKLPVLPLLEGRQLRYDYVINGVEAGCALAVALLLDEGRGLTSRLQQCGWSRCGRFSLDFQPKGRPRRFCSPEHKRRHDLETSGERVKRSRDRMRRRVS